MNGGSHQPPADALVLFGATGDLAKRKLFPALYQLVRRGELTVPVIGVARSDWTDEDSTRLVGSALIEALVADPEMESIVGVARRLPEIERPGVEWRSADIRDADLEEIFLATTKGLVQ